MVGEGFETPCIVIQDWAVFLSIEAVRWTMSQKILHLSCTKSQTGKDFVFSKALLLAKNVENERLAHFTFKNSYAALRKETPLPWWHFYFVIRH